MYVYLAKWEVTECGDVKARNETPPPHIETHNYSIGDGDDP